MANEASSEHLSKTEKRPIIPIDLPNTSELHYRLLGRESGNYVAQPDNFNCVPATLINVTRAIGYELVSNDGRSYGANSIRKALNWPRAPEHVDYNLVLPVLNALPKITEGQQNAFQHSSVVFRQGEQMNYTALKVIRDLILKRKIGIIVGFYNHESTWVPIISNRYVHIDSKRNPVKSAPQDEKRLIKSLRNGAPHSSPNREYPIFFRMATSRMAALSR